MPGPFAFASVTWGDSLALPAMTAFLTYAVRTLPPARADRVFAAVTAVLGGVAGALSQALWLADDHPRPNWTLPRPHHFTAAGWYHAAYVMVFGAVTAALLGLALNRAARAATLPGRVVAALAATVACGLAFAALLAADAGTTPGAAGLVVLVTAIAAGLLTAAVVVARRLLAAPGCSSSSPSDSSSG